MYEVFGHPNVLYDFYAISSGVELVRGIYLHIEL